MSHRTVLLSIVICFSLACLTTSAFGQQNAQAPAAAPYVPEDHRPPLFFRETWWRPAPGDSMPLSQSSITVPNVDLKIYGETKQSPPGPHNGNSPDHGGVEIIWRTTPKDDPTFVYMGPCHTPCAVALRDRNNFVDMTGLAKIKWRTKQSGFHTLRPIIKLADGTWLVGDYEQGPSTDWIEAEFSFIDVRWRLFNPEKVVTTGGADWVARPDLSKVDEIGFSDLMPGNAADGGHGTAGTSRVDWIEIHGSPVKR